MLENLSKSARIVGWPVVILFVATFVLIETNALDHAGIGILLACYATTGWVGYAGRLPVHVFGCRYLSRPSLHPKTRGRRQALNLLVFLNALSIVLWALLCVFMFARPEDGSFLLEGGFAAALFLVVYLVALITVRQVSDRELELDRGTEWICASAVGRIFEHMDRATPEQTPIVGSLIAWLKTLTPRHAISAFLILVSSVLLAVPVSGFGAPLAVHLLRPSSSDSSGLFNSGANSDQAGGSYEAQCPGLPSPGSPAPSPQRQQLYALWLGGQGLGILGDGAEQAGCAHSAEQVPGQTGVYFAPGFCGSELRSLGVTSEEYFPALLYTPAAGFALHLAENGVLVGASRRHAIRGGDFYLIDTSYGSWILIRHMVSTGSPTNPRGKLGCERVAADNVAYQRIPPGLLGIWRDLAEHGWVWPEQVGAIDIKGSEFEFRGENPDAPPVARARCATPTYCTMSLDEGAGAGRSSPYTTVRAIEELAR